MEKKKQSILVWVGLVFIVLLSAVAFQTYAQRGIQARVRDAARYMSSQTQSLGNSAQYEAYYQSSNYSIDRTSAGTATQASAAAPINIPRKVIKNASMSIKVSDVKGSQKSIEHIVDNFKGIVVNSNISKNGDDSMSGAAVFKVLPKDLDAVVSSLRTIGEVQSENITGEDVTDQYVDVQARLQSWKLVKDRLTKILDERAREVKDILEVERELARVAGEIESMEGRLQYLSRQVDMSTITVNYFSVKPLVVLKGIDFKERFKSAVRTSVEVFVNTFNGVFIVLAFVFPLAIWGTLGWIVFLVVKRIRRQR